MNTERTNRLPQRFLIGLAVGFSCSLCALEFGKPYLKADPVGTYIPELFEEEEIIVTMPPKRSYPKPPVPPAVIPPAPAPPVFPLQPDPVTIKPETLNVNLDSLFTLFPPDTAPSNDPLVFVDIPAEFPGGVPELYQWLGKNLRYPRQAQVEGAQGVVHVKFVVRKDGTIDEDKIEVLASPHPALSEEVKRMLKKMPEWKPARLNGRRVHSYFILPVRFTQP